MNKFVEFLGGAWINGTSVAVYNDGDGVKLCAETTGGKKISNTARLTADEYAALKSECFDDVINNNDALAASRALDYMFKHHPLPA
ncbi:MAG: hypothetical protein QM612_02220 [Thermomonas sp.]|uniref:hypothetical protein n=1 Tax=Thermomonas sp. TaxID=1971895 RepID=UPI0039E6935A